MDESDRLAVITQLLREHRLANQQQLIEQLEQHGFQTTQSSISRDLKKLGVVKHDGAYRIPSIAPGESGAIDRLDASRAGDNMLVLRTGPGNANRAAVLIDEQSIPGILGTIAGDDTIFVAVASAKDQTRVLKKIFSLFN